ncbi:MAG TPA: DUF5615 family PIN-like protein [Candidatus Hodarchaeales archaeon]|nr:DUF5615 family PIN-like protein [Candidatus Hodarchaeales archaeon]
MRILLDENVPYAAKNVLTSLGYQVDHVKDVGLQGLENGALLQKAKNTYDLLITNDKDFSVQKNLQPTKTLGVILLRLGTTKAKEEIDAIQRLFSSKPVESFIGKLTVYSGQ